MVIVVHIALPRMAIVDTVIAAPWIWWVGHALAVGCTTWNVWLWLATLIWVPGHGCAAHAVFVHGESAILATESPWMEHCPWTAECGARLESPWPNWNGWVDVVLVHG